MFTALADNELDIKSSLHKVIALSPCVMVNTKFEKAEQWKAENYFEAGLYKFPSVGIHAFKGPNWERDLAKICSEFRTELCEEFTKLSEDKRPGLSRDPTSMLNLRYWWNNGFQNRYQEFAPDYLQGERITKLIDIAAISEGASIAMFVPEVDELCPFEPLKDLKVDYIKWYKNAKHTLFDDFKEPEFVSELLQQLQVVVPEDSDDQSEHEEL